MSGSPATRAAGHTDSDAEQLAALGYSSNFERSMSLWENFSLGFTYLSPVVGVYTLFGQTLRNQTAGLAMELSGQDAATAIGNANTNATAAQTNANTRKGLDNYNVSNRP